MSGERHGERRAQPAGTVDPGGVVHLRRDALDGGHEEHHVEADEAPDDGEHDGGHRRPGVAQPREVLELLEADPREQPVEQASRRVVHLRPQQPDDDRRDRVGEERDDPVEARVAQPTNGPMAGAPDRHHRGQREAEHDGDDRHDDREQDVVPQCRHEDVVVEQLLVVRDADELHVRGEAAPVRQRVVERLDEGPDDEHQEDRQGQPEEHDHEADPVEGQLPPGPLASGPRLAVGGSDQRGVGHETVTFLIGVVVADLVGDLLQTGGQFGCVRVYRRGSCSTRRAGPGSCRRGRRSSR